MKKIGKWIPVSSGRFPENNTVVQVTYLDPLDLHTLRCNAFAFYKEGIWYQSTGNHAMRGEVIAWRTNEDVCHPEIPINGWIPAIQLPEEMKDVRIVHAVLQYIDLDQFTYCQCFSNRTGVFWCQASLADLEDRIHGHSQTF